MPAMILRGFGLHVKRSWQKPNPVILSSWAMGSFLQLSWQIVFGSSCYQRLIRQL